MTIAGSAARVPDKLALLRNHSLFGQLPAAAVLAHGFPADQRAGQAYLRYAIKAHNPIDATAIWDWMVIHRLVDDQIACEYVNFEIRPRGVPDGCAGTARSPAAR